MCHDQELINSGISQGKFPVSQGTLLDHIRCISCVGLHLDDLSCSKRQTALADTFELLHSQERYPAMNIGMLIPLGSVNMGCATSGCLPDNWNSDIIWVKEQRPGAQSQAAWDTFGLLHVA